MFRRKKRDEAQADQVYIAPDPFGVKYEYTPQQYNVDVLTELFPLNWLLWFFGGLPTAPGRTFVLLLFIASQLGPYIVVVVASWTYGTELQGILLWQAVSDVLYISVGISSLPKAREALALMYSSSPDKKQSRSDVQFVGGLVGAFAAGFFVVVPMFNLIETWDKMSLLVRIVQSIWLLGSPMWAAFNGSLLSLVLSVTRLSRTELKSLRRAIRSRTESLIPRDQPANYLAEIQGYFLSFKKIQSKLVVVGDKLSLLIVFFLYYAVDRLITLFSQLGDRTDLTLLSSLEFLYVLRAFAIVGTTTWLYGAAAHLTALNDKTSLALYNAFVSASLDTTEWVPASGTQIAFLAKQTLMSDMLMPQLGTGGFAVLGYRINYYFFIGITTFSISVLSFIYNTF